MAKGNKDIRRYIMRKIRKGTHSCWECRRRKIRCRFSSQDDLACISYRNRGSVYRSQQFADDGEGFQLSVRQLAQRLSRLEELMDRLAERVVLNRSEPTSDTSSTVFVNMPGSSSTSIHPDDHLNSTRSTELGALQSSAHIGPPSPHGYSQRASISGPLKQASPASFSSKPGPGSQPTTMAKQLLQLAICMQQLSPRFDITRLSLHGSIAKTMRDIIDRVDKLVMYDHQQMATLQGLECLLLSGYWHSNAGNLRQAWLIFRRALSVCQLLGINREHSDTLCSAQPREPSPQILWYRSISNDRYLSLLLGTAIGYQENGFASKEATERNSDWEKLEKLHMVISAKIVKRKNMTSAQAYTYTRETSLDIQAGAEILGETWWKQPILDQNAPLNDLAPLVGRLILQMNHHLLLLLLHIPYMLNSTVKHGKYSRALCIRSSRSVLTRFTEYRHVNDSAFSCRHVDYAALLAAMTLLLSYTSRYSIINDQQSVMQEDKELVLQVKGRMDHAARLNDDGPLIESSAIIEQLLIIMEEKSPEAIHPDGPIYQSIRLQIPYFGTVSISRPSPNLRTPGQTPSESEPPLASKSLAAGNEDEQGLLSTMQNAQSAITFQPEPQFMDGITPLADAADWALQGVDATYWSFIQGDFVN
ncbi:hypothetical protein DER44DRAFT_812081 [Fusarium oxysporum]|nr:hypothetical protein DER44DRAFT_812081 [Fusarium oxysporum]